MRRSELKVAVWSGWLMASVAVLPQTDETPVEALAILAAGAGLGVLSQLPPLNRPLTATWDGMMGAIYGGRQRVAGWLR